MLTTNSAIEPILPDEIHLKEPYWIAATLPALLTGLFLISQRVETHVNKMHEINRRNYILLMEDTDEEEMGGESEDSIKSGREEEPRVLRIVLELLFSEKRYTGLSLAYMVAQIFLFIISFVFTQVIKEFKYFFRLRIDTTNSELKLISNRAHSQSQPVLCSPICSKAQLNSQQTPLP